MSSLVDDAVGAGVGEDRVRHLYLHLPFCAHRCGYCDFVTVTGHADRHGAYVDALLCELELERGALAEPLATLYLGGGTPTLLQADALARLLCSLPRAGEVTVEANPETVTTELARLLRAAGVNRISLGVQSFQEHLLAVLERQAGPADLRRAFFTLREAGFDNLSLDLIYGIPGQTKAELEHDLEQALGLGPDHLSCYELEAKPGTRFTHLHGERLAPQAEAMEGYFELVVERLVAAGYRWYETASFARPGRRAEHNLAYWLGRDYLGLGIGAVSTVAGRRWRNRPSLAAYCSALARGEPPPRESEALSERIRQVERVMLGLRLDEPLPLPAVERSIDGRELDRLVRLGLVEHGEDSLVLTSRGRLLGGAVTASLLLEIPA